MKIKHIRNKSNNEISPFKKIEGVQLVDETSDADRIIIEARNRGELESLDAQNYANPLLWWRSEDNPPLSVSESMDVVFARNAGQVIYHLLQGREKKPVPDLNPLTGLPANKAVFNDLRQISNKPRTAACYLDLTDFKPYNEVYGFTSGDRVIAGFADMLSDCLEKICGSGAYFLGHIGGDDFYASAPVDKIEALFEKINSAFLILRESFYTPADKSRGEIVAFNRKGEREKFRLMGICGVAFSPASENISSPERAAAFATYLKETAKSLRVSDNVFITPSQIDFIPGGLVKFSLNTRIPLARRRAAIEAMGQSGMAHYGRSLIQIYEQSCEVMVRKSVLYSLGRLRFLPALNLITEALNDVNPHIRTRAVEALGNIGGAGEVERIGEMLSDPNRYTAIMAAKSLGHIGHPDGLKYLKNLPENASRWLKMEAAHSRCILRDYDALELLEKMLKDLNYILRKKASLTISFIKTPRALEILLKYFFREKNPDVRESQIISALRIIKKIDPGELEKFSFKLWKMYRKTPDKLKAAFLSAAARTGSKKFIKEAEKRKGSLSGEVRREVTGALAFSGDPGHREYVLSRLQDECAPAREKSAEILGEMKNLSCIEGLRQALKDRNSGVRKTAARSIIRLVTENNEP